MYANVNYGLLLMRQRRFVGFNKCTAEMQDVDVKETERWQGGCGNSLYFPLSLAANLKLP